MNVRQGWTVPVIAFLLWVPAMTSAAHEWEYGNYYGYGWVVPPVGAWLMWRRWRDRGLAGGQGFQGGICRETPTAGKMPVPRVVWVAAAVLLPWFALLRVLSYADPAWRMPIGLAGMTAAVASHWLLAWCLGWRGSAGFWRITLFLGSALPLPSVVESRVVRTMTDWVLGAVSRLFELAGEPVVVAGELLIRHGAVVEVSDGCSGIRSFHWFVMGTWLFAELYRLSWQRSLALLVWAAGMAFVINVLRAWTLAQVSFTFGQEAFDIAHDWVGVVAFVISALLFQQFSSLLSGDSGGNFPRRPGRQSGGGLSNEKKSDG